MAGLSLGDELAEARGLWLGLKGMGIASARFWDANADVVFGSSVISAGTDIRWDL